MTLEELREAVDEVDRKRVALRRLSYEQGRWVRNAILHGSAAMPPAA